MDVKLVLNSFLLRYFADAAAGGPQSSSTYERLYPGHEALIADEYARLGSPAALPVERQIGRYRLVRELGRGGQGVVHLAVDTQLNRPVALKVLSSLAGLSDGLLRRFRREAEVGSRIDHPGICAVFDAGEHEGVPFIAMRYVEGETLAQRIIKARESRSGVPPIVPTLELIEKAGHALHAAHEAGVLHRDIKPGNIMITRRNEPVILDFGLARVLDADAALTQTGDFFGTPSYMSPEQVAGDLLDARTDIYSLGATLYEALTLHRPFEEPTRERLYHAICTRRPADPSGFNPAVRGDLRIVLACVLEADRGRRYQTVLDFTEDLRRIRAHQPILARPVGPLSRLAQWSRRNPALAASLSALLVLMLAALGVTTFLLRDARQERDEKESALVMVERMSDIKRLEDLRSEADVLWPAVPANVPAMRAWLDRAAALERALPVHRAALSALRQHGRQVGEGGLARWAFSSTEQQWRHDTLAKLVADIEAFVSRHPATGMAAEMRERIGFAESVENETLIKPKDAWARTVAEIADPATSPYGGIRLTPQLGLVPIGPDPVSKLFEFVHVQTGAVPRRDTSGRLLIGAESGVVLVLIPGGRFEMGAIPPGTEAASGHSNLDPDARTDETPPHDVGLDPFFISKYEMTQAQWVRVTGSNPATDGGGMMPLNHATFEEITRTMARIGLELPTEAQWEYAARARTTTPWWTGAETRSVAGAGNVADRSGAINGPKSWTHEDWDDGYGGIAPVGLFRANPFGLHDVIGNVWEWCRDPYAAYTNPVEAGTGLRRASSDERVSRGGSYIYAAADARSARRSRGNAIGRSIYSGVRPARRLRIE